MLLSGLGKEAQVASNPHLNHTAVLKGVGLHPCHRDSPLDSRKGGNALKVKQVVDFIRNYATSVEIMRRYVRLPCF